MLNVVKSALGGKKIFLTIVLCILSVQLPNAQSQFQIAIGGPGVNDAAYSIIRTTDGGYAVAGQTNSFGAGSVDIYIVKLNSNGTLQWTKTIGGAVIERALSIIQTSDGGYALTGYSSSFSGSSNVYIAKLDTGGALQWNKLVVENGFAFGYSIIQTTDGGYAVAVNNANSRMHILKLTSNGTLQWNKDVEGTNNETEDGQRLSIKQTSDGGYAIGSSTNTFGAGNFDMYLVKLDSTGSFQWSRTVGGTGLDNGYSLTLTSDGGYALAGITQSFGAGSIDMYIVKFNSSGSLQWTRTVGGSDAEWAYSIIQTIDGGYAVAGRTQSFGGTDMYLVKLDAGGTLQWSKTVGGSSGEWGYSVVQTADSGYIMAGWGNSFGAGFYDMYIVKLNVNGNTCGSSNTPASISGTGGIIASHNPQVVSAIVSLITPTPTISSGGILTNICNVVGIVNNENELPRDFKLYQNYPNPFNPSTKIRFDVSGTSVAQTFLSVYDILGREITTLVNEQLQPGTYEVEFDGTNLPSGIYYYTLSVGQFTETRKAVLIK